MRLAVYNQVYNQIAAQPGLRPSDYARLCGVHRSSFLRILPALEYNGYLLYEDNNNRLWPYRIVVRCPEEMHDDPVSRWTAWRRKRL